MSKKLRIDFPKTREDLERVYREVMETHPELSKEIFNQEFARTVDTFLDIINTRLSRVEGLCEELVKDVTILYKLVAHLVRAFVARDESEKRKILEEVLNLLKSRLSSLTM